MCYYISLLRLCARPDIGGEFAAVAGDYRLIPLSGPVSIPAEEMSDGRECALALGPDAMERPVTVVILLQLRPDLIPDRE